MNDKLHGMLGMCRRAGRLVTGTEAVKESITKKKAVLLLVAADTAARTEKELKFIANGAVEVLRLGYTGEEISSAIGKQTKVIAVTDEGFAKTIKTLTSDEKEGRTSL